MATLPLLLFPKQEKASRTMRGGGVGKPPPRPTHDKQGRRLLPKFEQLHKAFEDGRMNVQKTAAGADPEKVLVIETIGSVADFVRAVKGIDGLKWMGELADGIDADDDFYSKDNKEENLPGRLYLVMTNQQGISNLVSLWKQFHKDKNMKFPRGVTPLREAFCYLNDIRYWSAKDRIEETQLCETWSESLLSDADGFVRLEAELWFRQSDKDRKDSAHRFKKLIEDEGGIVLDSEIIEAISYHGILAKIPISSAQKIADKKIKNKSEIKILQIDEVMFYSPVGQAITDKSDADALPDHDMPDTPPPSGEPIVGILDGVPLRNHESIKDRLRFENPDSYDVPANECAHGTAMASLVIHGDLADMEEAPMPRLVYMRPIMKMNQNGDEALPDDVLVIDLIHRAVRRMFEGEGTSPPASPEVKIINLSIGYKNRLFAREMSPLARLLDWLSYKYKILFVISAGNHGHKIEIDKSRKEFQKLTDDEKEALLIQSIYKEERHRKILSPAESINGVTVGALHDDTTQGLPEYSNIMELFKSRLPSPISAFGGGDGNRIKPDLVFKGGKACYDSPLESNPLIFRYNKNLIYSGIKTAHPGALGMLNKYALSCGTSNAAALISRMGAKCYDTLLEVIKERTFEDDVSDNIAPLIKAMVVHGCSWGEAGDRLKSILEADGSGKQIKNTISRWLGYGVPNSERVLGCTEQRATLLGLGHLEEEEAHVFTLPLPPSLGGQRGLRRLTITLAWLSPIKPSTQVYRMAKLWFEIEEDENKDLGVKRHDADWNAVRRGTVQHELFEGERVAAITEGDTLKIKVNCRKDATETEIMEPVPYGLVVTLEVAEGIDIPVYEEISTRIRIAG